MLFDREQQLSHFHGRLLCVNRRPSNHQRGSTDVEFKFGARLIVVGDRAPRRPDAILSSHSVLQLGALIRCMLGQYTKGRVYVFVDAANILYSQRTLGWRVDYQKLKAYFETECDLRRMYFYTGRVGSNVKQQSFLRKLEAFGYVVKAKEVKRIQVDKDTFEWKGNLDVELTIDVLQNLPNFDTLVLLSGDSDFAALLDSAKNARKRAIVMSTKGHVAKELLDRAKYINLKKLKGEIAYH